MAINVTRMNINTIRVWNLDPACGFKNFQDAGNKYGRWLQDQIADLFESERVVGGALRANTSSYTASKASAGLDTRRGHRTGRLQRALDRRKLWRVRVETRRGQVFITADQSLLRSAINYAHFYLSQKVPAGTILGYQKQWLDKAKDFFRGCEKPSAMRKGRRAA